MVVIQRVRWDATSRGATHADRRRSLPEVLELPASLPRAPIVVHDVLLDDAADYRPTGRVHTGYAAARAVGLWIQAGETVTVDRPPARAAFPKPTIHTRLFALDRGQMGRYRANFRFTGCCCSPSWYYEQWTIHVAHTTSTHRGLLLHRTAAREVDHRVHLYGGPARRSTKQVRSPGAA